MIVYVDSSVALRLILGQPGRLRQWRTVERAVASQLLEVECLRTLDRLRLREVVRVAEFARHREAVFSLLEEIDLIEPSGPILTRASESFPVPLGTLDAIHLATALLWREHETAELVMATHDEALAEAARASGMPVVGA